MSHNVKKRCGCSVLPMPGVTLLTFPDGFRSTVVGLDEILAAVYDEGRAVSPRTAQEILERLAVRNRIDRSVRQRYQDLLLEEYRKYVETGINAAPTDSVANCFPDHGLGMAEPLSRLLLRIFPPTHPWSRL